MSDYAFPADLADRVTERWHAIATRHEGRVPELPRPADLRHILSTAFFASFEREEGRNLRFVLCCSPDLEVTRDGLGEVVPVMPLHVFFPSTALTVLLISTVGAPNVKSASPESETSTPSSVAGARWAARGPRYAGSRHRCAGRRDG